MDITTQQLKRCDLLTVKGRVDSATAPKLVEALDDVINAGRYKLVIDMSELEYMSSAGLRALLAAQRNCKRYGRGDVVFASVPENIEASLGLAGFNSLFLSYPNITAAVGSM